MTSMNAVPELKQVLGAMLFGSRQPVAVADMRRVLVAVAENNDREGRLFAKVTERDVLSALDQLKTDLAERHVGVHLVEVAGGFRFQTNAECGPWLKHLLNIGKPSRLSRPALETLAIIAYRQPVTKSEIEAVRGVIVDTIVRNLQELQLIRIVGRSPLPGRPLLYGTTQLFLEHFGLKSLKELPGIEQLCRREEANKAQVQPPGPAADGEVVVNIGKAEPETETEAGGEKEVDAVPGEEDQAKNEKKINTDDDDSDDEDDNEDEDEDEDEDDSVKSSPVSMKKTQEPESKAGKEENL